MIPVDQTKLGTLEENREDNCLAACVASILELDLADVLDLPDTASWLRDLAEWMVTEHKLCPMVLENLPPFFHGHAIAYGPGPRGHLHAVVWRQEPGSGAIAHDPHPSRAGLKRANRFVVFVKT